MNISKKSLLAIITPGLITLGLIALSLMVLSLPAQARIKCWENSDGVRECGEKVPPEYSQKSHKEISSQGITLEESERARTEEERAEDDRLAAIQKEEDRKKAEIEKQDKILLDTYSNTDDIQMTSDGKIAALESTIKLANKRNEKIQANLDKRTAAAAAAELAGKQPAEDLLKDIQSLQRQIKNNNKFIADKRLEQEAIKKEYAYKIVHFKELTGKSKSQQD
ncbi:MAG: hypothetical protein V3R41_01510 [Gammaproteobacteria bacterium]